MNTQQKNISDAAKEDVQRLDRSIKAMNIWYLLALYLLLALGSVVVVWAAYTQGISAPYMYIIACITLIAGITFRYFAVTKIGRFIVGLFAFVYSVFWTWVLFNQAVNGVMVGNSPQKLVFPMEFYLGGGLFTLSTLMFMVQPFLQIRRKRLLKKVTRHITSTEDVPVEPHTEPEKNATGPTQESQEPTDTQDK